MKKSIADRIKITRTGKVLRRIMGQGHFRSKKRTAQIKRKKGFKKLDIAKKILKKHA